MYENVLFLDFETSGLFYQKDVPTEVAIKKVRRKDGKVLGEYQSLIKLPDGRELGKFIKDLTGLTEHELEEKGKDIEEVKKEIQRFFTPDTVVVMHNASFDLGFLHGHMGIDPENFICTYTLYSLIEPKGVGCGLQDIYARYIGDEVQSHRAMGDVLMLEEIFNYADEGVHMPEYLNKMIKRSGREILYEPVGVTVIDYENLKPDRISQFKVDK